MPGLPLNVLDAALGLVLVGSIFHALRRGLLREGSVYLGLLAAMYVAGRYAGPASGWLGLAPREPIVTLAVYLALLAGVLVVVAAATVALQPLAQAPIFWLLDRVGGAVVGIGQGLLVGALLLTAALQVSAATVTPQLADSRLAPIALRLLEAVLNLVPGDILRLSP